MITIKGNQIIVTTEEERQALFEVMEKFEMRFEHNGEEVLRVEAPEEIKFVETEHPEDVYIRQNKDTADALTFVYNASNHWDIGPQPTSYDPHPESPDGDTRYNIPKKKPKFTQEEIDAVIGDNEIYQEVKLMLLDEQRGQVGYGMGKYPESLNAETWSTIETIDHIIGESIDELHYLVMLKVKIKKLLKVLGGENK